MKLLFVCTGNASRSPMAAALFEKLVKDRGREDICCESAGIQTPTGGKANPMAIRLCAERGIDLSGHRRRPLTDVDMRSIDRVIVFEEAHRQAVLEAGVPEEKIVLLGGGIADPFRKEEMAYYQCRDQIEDALPALWELVTKSSL